MNIFKKFNEHIFEGYSGLAIKNSLHLTSTKIITKIGGLIFTAIIARIFLPELFGLYSLALFTIFTFSSFSDMGIGTSLTRFISIALAKGDEKKAKSYSDYHLKLKMILTGISFFVLLVSAKFISNTYYQKPIFLALLAGSIFVIIISMIDFIENFFRSSNQFQWISLKETFFQVVRLLISPLLIILLLKYSLSQEMSVFLVVSAVFIPYLLTLIFFVILARKKIGFMKIKAKKLDDDEKKEVKKFILPLAVSLIFYTFLDQIDVLLLGKFVTSEFIGYYSAAFFLVSPATAIATLSTALFPIFSRLEGDQLKRGLRRSLLAIFIIAVLFTAFIVLLAPLIVKIVYGENYATAVNFLRLGALVIIPSSMIGVYVNYFVSKGKTNLTAKLLVFLTVSKLILGYLLVLSFVKISLFAATIGVILARVIIEYLHLGLLFLFSKRKD